MSLSALLPEATAAVRNRYGEITREEAAARRLEAELYNLDDLLAEQLLPPPDPPVVRATGVWEARP